MHSTLVFAEIPILGPDWHKSIDFRGFLTNFLIFSKFSIFPQIFTKFSIFSNLLFFGGGFCLRNNAGG